MDEAPEITVLYDETDELACSSAGPTPNTGTGKMGVGESEG